jgi:hypothetical protein
MQNMIMPKCLVALPQHNSAGAFEVRADRVVKRIDAINSSLVDSFCVQ